MVLPKYKLLKHDKMNLVCMVNFIETQIKQMTQNCITDIGIKSV
jgi:hypothetical protein